MKRLAVLLLLCLAVAGCGVGEGETASGEVTLTVTRDFGAEQLGEGMTQEGASESDTVMRLLQETYVVETRYGGGFVQEIDGVSGGREGGRAVDWFYYVNGIEAPVGSAQRRVFPRDRVWWDHHEWDVAQRIPAVVGSFPEPFLSGLEGKRFPVRLVCQTAQERTCDEVATRLQDAGVDQVTRAVLEQSPGTEVVRVVVGPWAEIRRDAIVRRLELGPAASGVYARPAPTGEAIALLDSRGRTVRTLTGAAGLVAATSVESQGPTWVVTGTDDVGVAAAAAALTEERLREKFAVAVDAGHDVALPVAGPGTGP